MRVPATIATILLLAACGGDDGGGDPILPEGDAGAGRPDVITNSCDGVEFELGTGPRNFEAVDSGDTIYLWRGPQNGYHFFLGVRAKGIDTSSVNVCWRYVFTSGPQTGEVFGDDCWLTKLTNDLGDGWHERVGIAGAVNREYWDGLSGRIRGKDARVDVTINDDRGCSATDGWDIHVYEEIGK